MKEGSLVEYIGTEKTKLENIIRYPKKGDVLTIKCFLTGMSTSGVIIKGACFEEYSIGCSPSGKEYGIALILLREILPPIDIEQYIEENTIKELQNLELEPVNN